MTVHRGQQLSLSLYNSPDNSPDEASPVNTAPPHLVKQHQLPVNRPIPFDCMSLSRFLLKIFSVADVTVLSSKLFQMLITRSEKKCWRRFVENLFFLSLSEWPLVVVL